MNKTNAMRMLDASNITYTIKTYPVNEAQLSGEHTARILNINPAILFKTLVLQINRHDYLVCCIPTNQHLNLKKVAKIAKVKKIDLLPMSQLLPLTGYIRGGCSPIGMKKLFPTFIDETIYLFDEICVSAGQRGMMLILKPDDLISFIKAQTANIII